MKGEHMAASATKSKPSQHQTHNEEDADVTDRVDDIKLGHGSGSEDDGVGSEDEEINSDEVDTDGEDGPVRKSGRKVRFCSAL